MKYLVIQFMILALGILVGCAPLKHRQKINALSSPSVFKPIHSFPFSLPQKVQSNLNNCPDSRSEKKVFDTNFFYHIDTSAFSSLKKLLHSLNKGKKIAFFLSEKHCPYQFGDYFALYGMNRYGKIFRNIRYFSSDSYDEEANAKWEALDKEDLRRLNEKAKIGEHYLVPLPMFDAPDVYFKKYNNETQFNFFRSISYFEGAGERDTLVFQSRLGRGAYGEVWSVWSEKRSKLFALKIYKKKRKRTIAELNASLLKLCDSPENCMSKGLLVPRNEGVIEYKYREGGRQQIEEQQAELSPLGEPFKLKEKDFMLEFPLARLHFKRNKAYFKELLRYYSGGIEVARTFSQSGLCHGDLKLKNLVKFQNRIYAIDFDSIRNFSDQSGLHTFKIPELSKEIFEGLANVDPESEEFSFCNPTSDFFHFALSVLKLFEEEFYNLYVREATSPQELDKKMSEQLDISLRFFNTVGIPEPVYSQLKRMISEMRAILKTIPTERKIPPPFELSF